jgi:hypothetical protein
MNTISLINTMPSSKSEVASFTKLAKDAILAGNENSLKIAVQLKAMEEVIKELRTDKDIQALTLKEAEKEGKSFKLYNAEFNIRETGVKYDYTTCDDSEWNSLEKQITELKEKQKWRETFLKSIKDNIFDDKGIMLKFPAKTSTTSVAVTLK